MTAPAAVRGDRMAATLPDRQYLDPADLRSELGRVLSLCHGCRLCFNLCPSFPTLFSFVDAHDGDVAAMTPTEQDQVVDECYQCKLCYLKCPCAPRVGARLPAPHAPHARSGPCRREPPNGRPSSSSGAPICSDSSAAAAPVVNTITARRGSLARRVMEKTVGIASNHCSPALRTGTVHHLVQAAGARSALGCRGGGR